MESSEKEAKRLEIEYQVVAEAANRKNEEFIEYFGKWLDLKDVDQSVRNMMLGFISGRFEELKQTRLQIKQLMEELRLNALK